MRWIIGDIHGMVQPLATLLLAARKRDTDAKFFFVGDYVNRGPDAANVIELMLALQNENAGRFVRGNHDDVFDLLVNGQSFAHDNAAADPLMAFAWFMRYGLANTLNSYGVDYGELLDLEQRPSMSRLRDVMSIVPTTHRTFIRNLEPVIEEEDFFVAHAMWDPNEPTESPGIVERIGEDGARRHQLIWGRFSNEQILRPKAWSRRGFFGHTPVANYDLGGRRHLPIIGPEIVLVDTAAAMGGRLTAYCAETGDFVQAEADGRLVQ